MSDVKLFSCFFTNDQFKTVAAELLRWTLVLDEFMYSYHGYVSMVFY